MVRLGHDKALQLRLTLLRHAVMLARNCVISSNSDTRFCLHCSCGFKLLIPLTSVMTICGSVHLDNRDHLEPRNTACTTDPHDPSLLNLQLGGLTSGPPLNAGSGALSLI